MSEAVEEAFQQLGYSSVKPEQRQAVRGVLNRDVFVILPTGYGKSACYQCLPLLYDKLLPIDDPSVVVVVTPLKAIMRDQVGLELAVYMYTIMLDLLYRLLFLSRIGIPACHISSDQVDGTVSDGVVEGRYKVVYFSPELLLSTKTTKWRKVLGSEAYAKRLRTFIVDEAHTVVKW